MVKIGINGFGRIGRLLLRISLSNPEEHITVINNPSTDPEYLAYLLKHDSAHNMLLLDVTYNDDSITVNGKQIVITRFKDPSDIPWDKYGVECVIDSTGLFTDMDSAKRHLNSTVKRVVVTSPSDDIPMFVIGANTDLYKDELVVSNASCTTNCLAPLLKIIDNSFAIIEAHATTVHSATASQTTVDKSNVKNWRVGRSAINNIIPASTGASKAVTKILPQLQDKLIVTSIRVPVIDVSLLDLSLQVKSDISVEAIKKCIDEYSISNPGIITWTEDPVVSSDIMNSGYSSYSSVLDVTASVQLNSKSIKLVAWYDNEYAYSSNVLNIVSLVTSK